MRVTIDQYRAYLAIQDLADNTIRAYSALAVRWCDFAATERSDPWKPDPTVVRKWAKQLSGTRSLAAQARAMLHHWCAANQTPDASTAFPVPRADRNLHTRSLDHEQAVQLLRTANLSGIPGLAVYVGLYTAGRRSEIASLAWPNIDLDDGTLVLVRDKTRDLHRVPIHPQLDRVLRPRRVPGEQWVFAGRYGGHVSPATIGTWVEHVARKAGIGHVTPHQLRHTALTEANDATGDLRAVQELAGHVSPDQTARYTKVSRERRLRAVQSLAWEAG